LENNISFFFNGDKIMSCLVLFVIVNTNKRMALFSPSLLSPTLLPHLSHAVQISSSMEGLLRWDFSPGLAVEA
jgi:hypothetical protein